MPGVDDQPVAETELDTIANPRQLTGTLGNAVRVGVPPGMQFDGRRTDACGRFDLPGIGVDEQRYFGAAGRQTLNRIPNACLLPRHVEPAFGGQLLASLRDQAYVFRPQALGEREHGFGDAHLEIHPRLQRILHQQHVALLDVPTILAQVYGDAVRPRLFGVQRSLDRIRIAGTARLTQRRDMVDVDTEQNSIGFSHAQAPSCS